MSLPLPPEPSSSEISSIVVMRLPLPLFVANNNEGGRAEDISSAPSSSRLTPMCPSSSEVDKEQSKKSLGNGRGGGKNGNSSGKEGSPQRSHKSTSASSVSNIGLSI